MNDDTKEMLYKVGGMGDPTGRYPQPWVGLRAEEIEKIQDAVFGMEPHYVALARAVEAKLKEKNT
jgi:hypothetical protein